MNGKLLLLVPVMLMLILSTGCWDYIEYENMALVSAVGIDMDEQSGQVTVSLQYLVPGSGSGGGGGGGGGKSATSAGNVAIETSSGLSIADALTKIQQVIGKRLFFGYMEVEIVGEEAAKNIMEDITGMNDRTTQIRNTADLVIASGKAADAISTIEPDISVPAGKHIRQLVKESEETGNAFPVIIEDFIEYSEIEGLEPAVPRIITTVSGKKGGEEKSDGSAGGSQGSESSDKKKEGYHRIDGMAAFKKGKFVGWLEGRESAGLAFITNQRIMPYLNVKTSGNADTTGVLYYKVSKSKSRLKVQLDGGKPVANISVYVEVDLRKYAKTMDPKTLTPEVIDMMQKNLESVVRSDIEAALEKGQKQFKSDIFGFGLTLYRQHPREWHSMYEKKWDDIFPDVAVNVKVNAKIISTGTNIMKFISK